MKFKKGDKVKAINHSDGWGRVKPGDIGIVKNIGLRDFNYIYVVCFENEENRIGNEYCFELVEPTEKIQTDMKDRIDYIKKEIEYNKKLLNDAKQIVDKKSDAVSTLENELSFLNSLINNENNNNN